MTTILLLAKMLVSTPVVDVRLPDLHGDFLSGRDCQLPEAARSKVALLALGFSYDSRFAVEAWTARLGRWIIDRGMRKGTPREDYEHVVTVYGDPGKWKSRFGVTDVRHAYLLVMDREGIVRWSGSGRFDEEQYRQLSAVMKTLLAAADQEPRNEHSDD